jgi:MSHA pilin protein MshD
MRAERRRHGRARGFTLIDVLVLIVMVGTLAGSLTVRFGRLAEQSAQAMRSRQLLGVAQTLLAEVRMMPFSFCDPQDARARLATGAFIGGTGCATTLDLPGAEPAETRYLAANRFDGVSDYQGFAMPGPGCAGLCDAAGNLLNPPGTALAGCNAQVTLAPATLPGVPALDAQGRAQAWRIDVTVRCPGRAGHRPAGAASAVRAARGVARWPASFRGSPAARASAARATSRWWRWSLPSPSSVSCR